MLIVVDGAPRDRLANKLSSTARTRTRGCSNLLLPNDAQKRWRHLHCERLSLPRSHSEPRPTERTPLREDGNIIEKALSK